MTEGWCINPAEVAKVLDKADAQRRELPGIIRQIESEPASDTVPGATAIGEFLATRVEPLRWIEARIAAVVDGTTAALRAYDDGDLAMAAAHQKAAGTIGAPTPLPGPRPRPPLGPPAPQ
ncbi:hypothetical protein GCM10027059_00050 [Myceligenerans halotolerans]